MMNEQRRSHSVARPGRTADRRCHILIIIITQHNNINILYNDLEFPALSVHTHARAKTIEYNNNTYMLLYYCYYNILTMKPPNVIDAAAIKYQHRAQNRYREHTSSSRNKHFQYYNNVMSMFIILYCYVPYQLVYIIINYH